MLWSAFLNNRGNNIHKWTQYFPVYERHFQKFQNQSVVLWEIGVCEGGSLSLWKQFLGPHAKIVGIDIDPSCIGFGDEQVVIRIGDQSDMSFLSSLIAEFGAPDIVIDDGSHMMHHMRETFSFVYPLLNNNGVYIVEDLHACYWERFGGGFKRKESFIELCKDLVDLLHAYHIPDILEPTDFTDNTFSICMYDSIVAFEKIRRRTVPFAMKTGGSVNSPLRDAVKPIPPQMGEVFSVDPAMQNELGKLNMMLEQERRANKALRQSYENSRSWKLTAPLRAMVTALKKLKAR